MTASWEGETFRLDTMGWCIKAGTLVALQEVFFTRGGVWADSAALLLGQRV